MHNNNKNKYHQSNCNLFTTSNFSILMKMILFKLSGFKKLP
jgi:hypothetical protein